MNKVRWGHLKELDRRLHVGSEKWKMIPRRLKHLSSWRRMHKVSHHKAVKRYGRKHGANPSSNLTLHKKLKFLQTHVPKKK